MKFLIKILEKGKKPIIAGNLKSARKVYKRLDRINFSKQMVYIKVDYDHTMITYEGEKEKCINDGTFSSLEEAREMLQATTDISMDKFVQNL